MTMKRPDPRKLAVVITLAISFAVALFFAPQIIIFSFSGYYHLCATGQDLENPGCIIGSSPLAIPVIIYGALLFALARSISWMRDSQDRALKCACTTRL